MMLRKRPVSTCAVVVALAFVPAALGASPLSSEWTYQGDLKLAGISLNGTADFEFTLWDAAGSGQPPTGGSQIGPVVVANNVAVVDGLFTLTLDFGVDALNGDKRWLQIAVASPSGGALATLAPRQPVRAAPYAVQTRGIFVDDATNVGIGTTSPLSPLHVEGDANDNAIRSNGTLRASKGVGESGPGISVFRQVSTFPVFSSHTLEIDGARLDGYGTLVGFGGPIHLNSTSSGNVLLANGGGDVGVGTTSPNCRLHVNGPSDGPAFRAQVSGATKLLVTETGGVSVGANVSSPPSNGLYVSGNVGIGTSSPSAKLHVVGTTRTEVVEITGADLAEEFPLSEPLEPGTVVMIDADQPGKLCLSRGAYNRRVAGIVAGAKDFSTGVVLGRGSGKDLGAPVALSGRVYVWCDASSGPIEPGDMLTTSDTPGHAMAVTDFSRMHGAVIGKAMESLEAGRGLVLVLVNLQ